METINNTQFKCPIGDCSYHLTTTPKYITMHIKKYHPQALVQLKLYKYAHYCIKCDTLSNHVHYHCSYCNTHNKTYEDAKLHKMLYHKKWWLENTCFKGQSCLDLCYYNHYEYERNYIILSDKIQPMSLCSHDMPWLNKYNRCSDINCTYDHLAGRASYIKDIIQINNNV
jgi:hypothetical protein